MADPLRLTGAVLGAGVVAVTALSIVATFVIPRAVRGHLARLVDRLVDALTRGIARPTSSYGFRDRVRAAQGAFTLLVLLTVWLLALLVGFGLLLWPFTRSLPLALREAGSSLLTLGFARPAGAGPTVVDFIAAASGLTVVALLIAYLPTLYGAFNRRETEVTLLRIRAGEPAWGPEILARTRYGVRLRAREDLAEFYRRWERWAADIAETHSTYPVLVHFRSPDPLSSWLVGLLSVLDSAALLHSLAPTDAPMQARLCLRTGFMCLRTIATALGLPYDPDPRPDDPLELTQAEFRAAVERLAEVDFPMERTADEAWPEFRGWRVNYEQVAYRLAWALDAVPAPWSGPRRGRLAVIAVRRPANRTPSEPDGHTPLSGRGPHPDL